MPGVIKVVYVGVGIGSVIVVAGIMIKLSICDMGTTGHSSKHSIYM